jgi:hypothetical protein
MAHLGGMAEGVYSAAILVPMWPHFVNLLWRSWNSFLQSMGTTGLGFFTPVVVFVCTLLVTLLVIRRRQGADAMRQHWRETATITSGITVGVMFIVYSPILAWNVIKTVYVDHEDLAHKIVALHASRESVDPSIPNLVGEIGQVATGEMDTAKYGHIYNYMGKVPRLLPMVMVWATIKNLGADSIAEKYHIAVHLTDGTVVAGHMMNAQNNLFFENLGIHYSHTETMSMAEKTIEKPIARGAQDIGVLIFGMEGSYTSDRLSEVGVVYDVSFQDVQRKEYHMKFTSTRNARKEPAYIPGTSPIKGNGRR